MDWNRVEGNWKQIKGKIKETWGKLAQGSDSVVTEYTISAADLKGPLADEIPAKYEDKAKLKRLDYTSAAERLRVNRTTVGRRIGQLEANLGVSLFEQTPNGYRPTAAGRVVLRRIGSLREPTEVGGRRRGSHVSLTLYDRFRPQRGAHRRRYGRGSERVDAVYEGSRSG